MNLELLSKTHGVLSPLLAASGSVGSSSMMLVVVIGLIFIVIGVVVLAGVIGIYRKAGKAWWVPFIPIYSTIVMLNIVGAPTWWVIMLLVPILRVVGLPAIVGAALSLVSLVYTVMVMHKLAQAFGKGGGFTIGLIFLPVIFYPILGLGRSQYIGPSMPVPPAPSPAPTM